MDTLWLYFIFILMIIGIWMLWCIVDILIDIRYILNDWWLKSIKQYLESQAQSEKN